MKNHTRNHEEMKNQARNHREVSHFSHPTSQICFFSAFLSTFSSSWLRGFFFWVGGLLVSFHSSYILENLQWSWIEICCFGCTCLQLYWPRVVLRKWLNRGSLESDFSADERDSESEFEDEGEEFSTGQSCACYL